MLAWRSGETRYILSASPVACGSKLSHPIAPTSVTCSEACSSHHFTGCTQPYPPRVMAHLPQPTRQNRHWFSFLSFLSFAPFPFCLHKSFVLWLHLPHSRRDDPSQGEANTKLDNSCETFCVDEDLGCSDITRIHKGMKLRRQPVKQL